MLQTIIHKHKLHVQYEWTCSCVGQQQQRSENLVNNNYIHSSALTNISMVEAPVLIN